MSYFATLGRVLLGLFFLAVAWDMYAGDHAAMMERMTEHHVPLMPQAYWAVMMLQAAGGAALLLGVTTRFVALVLAAYIIAISFYLHNFWDMATGGAASPEHAREVVAWVRNLAIVGGLLAFVGFGAGPLAVGSKSPLRGASDDATQGTNRAQ
ncbi:MAG: DoxX family membrane protein [Alphaproteobacteria bacterium]